MTNPKHSKPIWKIYKENNNMVPMRDGIHLATDIYHPTKDGNQTELNPMPALLVRTSYDKKSSEWEGIPEYYAKHGYVFIIQDIRSRFRSEGDGKYFHTVNRLEGFDGYDTVEWIARQQWSNGKIGTLGSSHRAITQTLLALQKPPHLSAMWIDAGPTNIYEHEAREGGAMSLQMFAALHIHALDSHEIGRDTEKAKTIIDAMSDMRKWIQRFPITAGKTALRVAPSLEQTALNYYLRGTYDEWWAQEAANQQQYLDRLPDIPIMLSCGWYDNFVGATTEYFNQVSKKNTSETKMILGPWTHGGMRTTSSSQGDCDSGPESVWSNSKYNPARLKFFDRHLKNILDDSTEEPNIKLFVMGSGRGDKNIRGKLNHGGHWRNENEWPLARTIYTNFYFQKTGLLTRNYSRKKFEPIMYSFNPNSPVPTIGGPLVGAAEFTGDSESTVPDFLDQWDMVNKNLGEAVPAGGFHQKEHPNFIGSKKPYQLLADRKDILTFQTDPLDIDTEITGSVKIILMVSSEAPDTDFTVKLVDVYPYNRNYPQGYHLNLTDTILRMRYRDGWNKETLMNPDEIYEITLNLWPISNVFKKGHHIRIDVSSSNFPRFDINPNTGEPLGKHSKMVTTENTVWIGGDKGSRAVLPIIPNNSNL